MIRFVFKHFLVILVVVFIHIVALVSGSVHKRSKETVPASLEPLCTMAFSGGKFSLPEIIEWSELEDPTLFSRPDYTMGFSSALTHSLPEAYTSTPGREISIPFSPPSILPASNFSLRIPQPAPSSTIEGLTVHYQDGDVAAVPVFPPKTIMWMWGNGLPIEAPPHLNGNLKAIDVTGNLPLQETRIRVSHFGDHFRMNLNQSSGNAQLDQLAMAAVGPHLSAAEMEPEKHPLRIMGSDFPAMGDTVRVEWRMCPDLKRGE